MGEIRLREAPEGTRAPNRLRAHNGCSEKQGLHDPPAPPHRGAGVFPADGAWEGPWPLPPGLAEPPGFSSCALLSSPHAQLAFVAYRPLSLKSVSTQKERVLVLPSTCLDFRPRFLVHLQTCSAHIHARTGAHVRTPPVPPTWSTSHSPSLCDRWGGGRFSCLYGPPLLLPLQALGVLANIWGGGVLARPHGPCRARGSPRKISPQFGCCVDAAPGGALLAGWVVPTPVPTTTELTRQPRLCARGRVDGWADGRMDVSFACGGSGSPWGSQVLSGTPRSCGTATEQDTWLFLPGEGPPEGSP